MLPTLLNLNSWRFVMWLVHVVFILFLLNCSWDRANCFVTARVVLFLLSHHYLFISNAIWLYLNHCFRCHLAASNWLDIFGCQHRHFVKLVIAIKQVLRRIEKYQTKIQRTSTVDFIHHSNELWLCCDSLKMSTLTILSTIS